MNDDAPTFPTQSRPGPHEPAPAPCRTRIKICGLTREVDVDAAVQAGADAIGFVFYPPSPRCVTPAQAARLARRLPPLVTPVLLFVNASADDIAAACDAAPGASIQFHGDEPPDVCTATAHRVGRPFWRAARIPPDTDADASAAFDLLHFVQHFSAAQAILLDAQTTAYGGSGRTFDWSRLPPNIPAHIVLSGGLTPANVGDGIRLLQPRCRSLAVDVSSGVESAKGIKDASKIRAFAAAVRAADALR